MNKYILCAMDKSKTEKDLKKNAYAAYDAAYAAHAAYDANNMDYWLNRYFERTGENREDYEKAIKEMEK